MTAFFLPLLVFLPLALDVIVDPVEIAMDGLGQNLPIVATSAESNPDSLKERPFTRRHGNNWIVSAKLLFSA